MHQENDKTIIICSKCKQKLRVPITGDKKLHIKCPRCGSEFYFDCKKYFLKNRLIFAGTILIMISLIALNVYMPIYLFSKTNSEYIKIEKEQELKIQESKSKYEEEKKNLIAKNLEEIKAIDMNRLKTEADAYYSRIWEDRKNYNSRYAITPREKAQLEMLALSKDKTRSIEDLIKEIAAKAAPNNSTINVSTIDNRHKLDINFDMSELTSGEEGSKTKHHTIESLKKEVIKLISQVTNDVFQFCQGMDLDSISVGCRHFVINYDEFNIDTGQDNTVLYKIHINKEDLSELINNPFLNTYSTTKYFKIDVNEFPHLKITKGINK